VQPGTLTVTWPHERHHARRPPRQASCGAATGSLNVAQNLLSFAPNVCRRRRRAHRDYVAGPKQEDSFAHPRATARAVPVTATLGSIEPGSLEIEWNTLTDRRFWASTRCSNAGDGHRLWNWVDPTQIARDDGNGVLR
jgi:hypothetical protein